MHSQSVRFWAMFCMGVWLMGTVCMAIVATENFYTIDRLIQVLPNAKFSADIDKLGHDDTRALLYYFSSELNRLYFQYWNIVQLAIGIFTLWLVVRGPDIPKAKWAIVAMLSIVIFLTVLITPRMVSVGRQLDFVPRVPLPDGLREFGLLHAAYTVFDGILLILGILVTIWLVKGQQTESSDA